jgi:hypothetical protein
MSYPPGFLSPAAIQLRLGAPNVLPASALSRATRAHGFRARAFPSACASSSSTTTTALLSFSPNEGVADASNNTAGSAALNDRVVEKSNDGPPLYYDRAKLKQYWDARSSELNQRYLSFAGTVAPFFASVVRHAATRTLTRDDVIARLAVQAREGMEALGPTYAINVYRGGFGGSHVQSRLY